MEPVICFILDDDPESISILKHYIEKIPWLTLTGFSTEPMEVLAMIDKGFTANIIFLDVEMPDLSGFEIAEFFENNVLIIFTTAHSEYGAEAWNFRGIDFLEKPFSYARFYKAVLKGREHLEKEREFARLQQAGHLNRGFSFKKQTFTMVKEIPGVGNPQGSETFFIKNNYAWERYNYDHLVHIKASENYISLVFLDGNAKLIHLSMEAAIDSLPRNFLRVQKSYIINLDYIKKVDGTSVLMRNDKRINIGAPYKQDFYDIIHSNSLEPKKKK